jgi:hypothetical protein
MDRSMPSAEAHRLWVLLRLLILVGVLAVILAFSPAVESAALF